MKVKIKIIFICGARPNFMKIAPLVREVKKHKRFKPIVVHTGQHYDYEMSEVFFKDLNIQKPHYYLGVGSGTHAYQTAEIMKRFEKVCIKVNPQLVIVVGDVNSTLACSVVAKKLHIKVAHIEAGLRSRDLDMPEEINRIVTDSIADYLFVTEDSGYKNLIREGKSRKNIFFIGNVMIDNLFYSLNKLKRINTGYFKTDRLKNKQGCYACLTLHRPSNVDDKDALSAIMRYLTKIASKIPIIFPVHPRTRDNIIKFNIKTSKDIIFVSPLPYLEFLNLWKDSSMILTDSGGLQEEATALGIPCLTLRESTERPITVNKGTNVIIGRNYNKLLKHVDIILRGRHKKGRLPKFWDGKASERIVEILKKIYNKNTR